MTSETAESSQDPQPQQHPVVDAVEVYRIVGGLETEQRNIKEYLVRIEQRFDRQEEHTNQRFDRQEEHTNQRFDRQEEHTNQRFDRQEEHTNQRFSEMEERTDRRFERYEERNDTQNRESNRRIDRLWYTIVGFGLAILAGFAGLAIQNALLD